MKTDGLLIVHPLKDQLIAFGQGKLAADESSSVEQHLEVCRECCETLLDLKDDTFVGLVRIAKPEDVVADASRVRTENGPDARRVGHDSEHAATLLVQSGETVAADELPVELREHPRYRIVELIGKGGMGNVYRAEHRLMNRPVAIKLINSHLIRHPQAVERFRREVQAAAKLNHPNIVAAYDAEQAGDVHFLVMEFVEGTDLASVVKHRGPMSVAEACRCIRQAAEGLQHAHEKGMVHRDIKPHNLMLSAEGQVRILDFGLAGFVTESVVADAASVQTSHGTEAGSVDHGQLTTMGSVMGTPDYIAPEQARDAHSADIRADIYSLGCTLHFLLTGQPPFVVDNLLEKLKAHAEREPEPLTKLRRDVPQELSNVVARMMAKAPAERFPTPAAVAEALAPFAKIAASPPKRRMPTLVAALWMSVAALLAGVIFVQTDKGRIEIRWEVDDVKVAIQQGGKEIAVIDMQSGSKVDWYPSGKYDIVLKGDRNDIEIHNDRFKLRRWGKEIVTLKPAANGLAMPEAQSMAADRKAAEYVLSIGGTVRIRQNGEEQQIVAGGDVTLPQGPLELTYVSLVGNQNVTDEGLAVFKDCTRLTSLYLQSTPVSNAGTVHFQKCKNLKFLDLGSTSVSDAGLAAFKSCKHLLSLNLGATHVTDEGLANFQDCHDLRTLYFYNAPNVNDVGVSYFKNCPNLMLLHLHGTKVTDVGLANFKGCSQITYLQLGKAPVGDEGLANFANCKNLRVVCLEATQVTDAGLANFKDCHDLEHLALNDTKVGDAGLGFIKNCKRLTAFHVPRTNVTVSLIDDLKTALPQCKIEWNNQVIEPRVKWISDQDAAKWVLSLGGKVRAAGVDQAIQFLADLPEWPAITSIDLAGNQEVTDAGLAYLKDAHHLVQLDLSGTSLTNAGLKHLAGCSRLVSLNANNTKVDEAGIQQLAAALPDCKIVWGVGSTRLVVPEKPNALVDVGRFTGHEGSVSHAIVSPGGRYGISCGADKTIRVWDIATLEEQQVLKGHEGSVFGLAISTDGKLLASGDNAKSIRLWNLETGEQVGELTGHTEAVTNLAFMPDRTHLLSAGSDDMLRLWHVADRKLVRTIDIGTRVEKMLPLPDGRRVMLSGAHTRGWGPTTYDLEKGEKIDATPNAYSCMAVSADGRMLLIGSITGVLRVTDTVNEKVIVQMTDPRANVARDAAARDAAITPDGRFAITTTREKQMHLWDLHQGKLLSTAELDSISTISLSPDGRFALTIGNKGGVGVWRLPESVLEPISPGSSDKARMKGKPAARTPPPALKLGANLVTDPTLEETALGQKYPQGWGTGNVNPPDSFKHRVTEGGRTGQRGWLIEGDGQFAVIPTNRPPAHSAYRYAASAWVRVEAGSAQIKLLYFDAKGQYLGENRGNVSIQQGDWHKLTMVDDLKSYPEARSLSLALTMIGQGKAVFDDLELLAFDANKLPEKFEATYGAASHSADVFDRWVGRWESTTTYAPTAVTPHERVLKGETIVRKVLDDRFLLWQWSSDDGQSQYLTLLCFDNNIQAYHIWLFGSGGEVFDRTGQWNAASQTLTLHVKPPSPGVTGTSTDRFVSQDRIESTLLVKGSGGEVTRDMRATWIRKSKTVEDEIALADGPRADVSELAVLQKMVGRWSVQQTIKPCIAFPQGDQATGTEHNAWVLGGRFFLNRAYDDQQRMTSLALQTYDPAEKTFRHWHFAKDVFGSQWRVTWDASSRAFHWRSIDMPAGWIGTGFNRWVNDDTFDNQALIKDENGRTIIDSKQDKRRKKP